MFNVGKFPASIFSLICTQMCTGHLVKNLQLIHCNCLNHVLYSEPTFPAPQLYLLRHTLKQQVLYIKTDFNCMNCPVDNFMTILGEDPNCSMILALWAINRLSRTGHGIGVNLPIYHRAKTQRYPDPSLLITGEE